MGILISKSKRGRIEKSTEISIIHLCHAAAILDLKHGWTDIKIAKMANDHYRVALCNNDKRYDSAKDFPWDKQK